MVLLLILFSFLSLALCNPLAEQTCGKSSSFIPQPRIIGGRKAFEGEFPWQVSVRVYSEFSLKWIHNCGGAILSNKTIVTSAHCVYKK